MQQPRNDIGRAAYFDLLETVARYVAHLQELRPSPDLDTAPGIIKEMEFIGMFNHKYREQTAAELNTLCDDLYVELNSDE
jgi:hypothetical protein